MLGELHQTLPHNFAGGTTKQIRDQVWNPYPVEFIKLNTDGVMELILRDASAVAVARDNLRSWRGGAGRNTGKCSVVQTELWAIYDGFCMAWDNC